MTNSYLRVGTSILRLLMTIVGLGLSILFLVIVGPLIFGFTLIMTVIFGVLFQGTKRR